MINQLEHSSQHFSLDAYKPSSFVCRRRRRADCISAPEKAHGSHIRGIESFSWNDERGLRVVVASARKPGSKLSAAQNQMASTNSAEADTMEAAHDKAC